MKIAAFCIFALASGILASCSSGHAMESRVDSSEHEEYSDSDADNFNKNFQIAKSSTESIPDVTTVTEASLGPGQFGGTGTYRASGVVGNLSDLPQIIVKIVSATVKGYEAAGYRFLPADFIIVDVKTKDAPTRESVTFELSSIFKTSEDSQVAAGRATYRSEADAICVSFPLTNGKNLHHWNMLLNLHDGSYRVWISWVDMGWIERYSPSNKKQEWSMRVMPRAK